MISNVKYDYSNLTEKVSGLTGALLGSGASAGDLQKLLDVETGQLAGAMGDSVGPKTQAKAMKLVNKNIKQFLTILPRTTNLNQESESYADFTWLYASPTALVGINNEDNQIAASGSDAMQFFRGSQKAGSRGDAYELLGSRGNQKIQRVNRTRVSVGALNYVRAMIRQKTGELRAAFYRVKLQYSDSRIPAWISEKIGQVIESGKSSLIEGGRDTSESFIEFGVRAPGVTTNSKIVVNLQGAIGRRSYIVREKLKKILDGYRYNWETGQVWKSQDFSDN